MRNRGPGRLEGAPVRTLIDRRLVDQLVGWDRGPRRCIPWADRLWCGETVRAKMQVPPCSNEVHVEAVAVQLPSDAPAPVIAGRDLLDRTVERIDFETGRVTCRRRKRI